VWCAAAQRRLGGAVGVQLTCRLVCWLAPVQHTPAVWYGTESFVVVQTACLLGWPAVMIRAQVILASTIDDWVLVVCAAVAVQMTRHTPHSPPRVQGQLCVCVGGMFCFLSP
jgi:hypothetical protein